MKAQYITAPDGTLTITCQHCGHVQVVPPVFVDEEGYAHFGSESDFCNACGGSFDAPAVVCTCVGLHNPVNPRCAAYRSRI